MQSFLNVRREDGTALYVVGDLETGATWVLHHGNNGMNEQEAKQVAFALQTFTTYRNELLIRQTKPK